MDDQEDPRPTAEELAQIVERVRFLCNIYEQGETTLTAAQIVAEIAGTAQGSPPQDMSAVVHRVSMDAMPTHNTLQTLGNLASAGLLPECPEPFSAVRVFRRFRQFWPVVIGVSCTSRARSEWL